MRVVSWSGEELDVVRRQKLTPKQTRQAVIMEMYLLREQGYSVAEIARKYRYHRWHVYRLLKRLPDSYKERLHDIGLA